MSEPKVAETPAPADRETPEQWPRISGLPAAFVNTPPGELPKFGPPYPKPRPPMDPWQLKDAIVAALTEGRKP